MIAHFVLPFKASPWAKLILSFSHQPVPSACCISANLMAWKLCQYTAARYFSTGQWCLQFREDSAVYAQNLHKAQVLNTNNEIFRFYRRDKGHSEVFTLFFFLAESLSAEPVTSLTVKFLNFSIHFSVETHGRPCFWRCWQCDQCSHIYRISLFPSQTTDLNLSACFLNTIE